MELLEYLKGVAKHLDGWTAGYDSNWHFLTHKFGGCIHAKFYQQGQQKRIGFSESWHYGGEYIGYYLPYDDHWKKYKEYRVTAKADTAPDKVARRLRKLIPEYLEAYNRCLESHKDCKQREQQKTETLQELATIVGSHIEDWNGCVYRSWHVSNASTPSLKIRGNSPNSFNIKLEYCNSKIAKQLLETLVGLVNEEN